MNNQDTTFINVFKVSRIKVIKIWQIITLDNCPEDNSIGGIKEYQKEDQRILLMLYDTNEDEMKSSVDSIRKVKEKYVTIID